jgi:peroxiredoxin family protein
MLGLGTWMIKKLMRQNNMPSIEELITMAQEMGVKMMPCSTSCNILGLSDDAFRDGILSQTGAAFFLNEARQSKITLFI